MNSPCSGCPGSLSCLPIEEEPTEQQSMAGSYSIAFAGQPNVGKSTLFNALTGVRQFVANYPGATVEKRSGIATVSGFPLTIVDLPGTYSLTSYSLEEKVAVDFLLQQPIDLIVQVADASNLVRSLYLTFQLLELERPMLMALTMTDVARGRGMVVDIEALSKELGIGIIATVANRGKGLQELKRAMIDSCANHPKKPGFSLDYGPILEPVIQKTAEELASIDIPSSIPLRWMAIKIWEDDPDLDRFLHSSPQKRRMHA